MNSKNIHIYKKYVLKIKKRGRKPLERKEGRKERRKNKNNPLRIRITEVFFFLKGQNKIKSSLSINKYIIQNP